MTPAIRSVLQMSSLGNLADGAISKQRLQSDCETLNSRADNPDRGGITRDIAVAKEAAKARNFSRREVLGLSTGEIYGKRHHSNA
jgi:hypothetical protein